MHAMTTEAIWRPLTEKEAEWLSYLLSKDFPGRDQLLEQSRRLMVKEECGCGCPTIGFSVEKDRATQANVKRRIPIEAAHKLSDGSETHVLLHVVSGWLEEMEIYRDDGVCVSVMPPIVGSYLLCLDWAE